jgi:hypothetical protein
LTAARGRAEHGAVTRIRVLYWRDIPVQVTAREGADEVTVPLTPRFQELVDAVAVQTGTTDSEAYLAGWHHGPEEERPGSAQEAAHAAADRLEAGYADLRARALGLSSDPSR